jgi:hypothetical protein
LPQRSQAWVPSGTINIAQSITSQARLPGKCAGFYATIPHKTSNAGH